MLKAKHLWQGCGGGMPFIVLMLNYCKCSQQLGAFSDKEEKSRLSEPPDGHHGNPFCLESEWYICWYKGRKLFPWESVMQAFINDPNMSLFQPPHATSRTLADAQEQKKSPTSSSMQLLVLSHTQKRPRHCNSSTYDSFGSVFSRTGQMHKIMPCQVRCWRAGNDEHIQSQSVFFTVNSFFSLKTLNFSENTRFRKGFCLHFHF